MCDEALWRARMARRTMLRSNQKEDDIELEDKGYGIIYGYNFAVFIATLS